MTYSQCVQEECERNNGHRGTDLAPVLQTMQKFVVGPEGAVDSTRVGWLHRSLPVRTSSRPKTVTGLVVKADYSHSA